MRKIVCLLAAFLMLTGYAAAIEYWKFEAGMKGVYVMPSDDYENAMGIGLVGDFVKPSSRFSVQVEFETWRVSYDSTIQNPTTLIDSLYPVRENQYSAITVGAFLKYRTFNFTPSFSNYLIAGAGGDFISYKKDIIEISATDTNKVLHSMYLHPRFMAAAGLGFEYNIFTRFTLFTEGRFLFLLGKDTENEPDPNFIMAALGFRYKF